MLKIGTILEPYDADKAFVCYGFGAYLSEINSISNCFAMNGDEEDPVIFGSISEVT